MNETSPKRLAQYVRQAIERTIRDGYPLAITIDGETQAAMLAIIEAAEPHLPRDPQDISHHEAICTRGRCCLACHLHCDCSAKRGEPHTAECRLTHECRLAQ